LQLQAKYIPNMAKNSVAQYEVVAVNDEGKVIPFNGCGDVGGSSC